jgi:vitamin B12 transporter
VAALAVALCLASAEPAQAQDQAPARDTIIVSGSRMRLEAREIGSAVTVVTADDIAAGQIETAKEILQDVPGVQITDNRPGGLTSLNIRGVDNDQVLVLLDGIELGDPSGTNTQFNFDHLSAGDIERIEVLRGNQSSLYGSDAIGGVINIITKRPPDAGTDLNLDAETGSDGVASLGASILGNAGLLDYRLSVDAYSADGPSLGAPNRDDPNPVAPIEDDPYDRLGLGARIGLQVTDGLQLRAIGMHSDTETANDGAAPFEDDARADKDESAWAAQLVHDTGDGRWHNELSLTRYEAEGRYFGPFNPPEGDRFTGKKSNLRFSSALDVSAAVALAVGFDLEKESADQLTSFSGAFIADIETDSLFAEAALTPTDLLTMTLAARADDNSRFGDFRTYRVTAAYVLADAGPETKVRASWGTGAKAPGLYQLFDPAFGNESLTAEESEGYDVGVDMLWDGGRSFQLTWFRTDIENEIDFEFPVGYGNLGRTEARGVEIGFATPVSERLDGSLGYTYLSAYDAVTGDWLGRPRHSATGRLSIAATAALDLSVRARYRSLNEASFGGATDSFVVVDLLGRFAVSERIEVYGRIVNLFDEDYQLSWGYNTLDRSAFAGVRLRY